MWICVTVIYIQFHFVVLSCASPSDPALRFQAKISPNAKKRVMAVFYTKFMWSLWLHLCLGLNCYLHHLSFHYSYVSWVSLHCSVLSNSKISCVQHMCSRHFVTAITYIYVFCITCKHKIMTRSELISTLSASIYQEWLLY